MATKINQQSAYSFRYSAYYSTSTGLNGAERASDVDDEAADGDDDGEHGMAKSSLRPGFWRKNNLSYSQNLSRNPVQACSKL